MNDRLKFRVWDKVNEFYQEQDADDCYISNDGKLLCVFWGDYDTMPTQYVKQEDAVIEQCTGLKDKNGKLIFEGDVVRVEDECGICDPMMNCGTGIGVITWKCEMWYIDRNVNLGLYDTKQVNYIEIIGNIHEMEVITE